MKHAMIRRWLGLGMGVILTSAIQAETIYINGDTRQEYQESESNPANLSILIKKLDDTYQEILALKGDFETLHHELKHVKQKLQTFNQTPGKKVSASVNISPKQSRTFLAKLPAEDRYARSFKFIKLKQYAKASSAFEQFVSDFPKHKLTPNAYYWLGELALSMRQYKPAAGHFNYVLQHFPRSNKVADARLKLSYIELELGRHEQGRLMLRQLVQDHPKSLAAKLAQNKLLALQQATNAQGEPKG